MIRAGIRRFTDETGRLWCALADFFIRLGLFEKARDVYEEGLSMVMTVRDFSIVFDTYALFEESMLTAKLQLRGELGEAVATDTDDLDETGDDVDLRLARLERLMEHRPQLLSLVLLRQNPHNVYEWHKRAKVRARLSTDLLELLHFGCVTRAQLFDEKNLQQIIKVYTEAVKTVDPMKAVGKPHSLWVEFAKLYEKEGDLDNARVVLKRVCRFMLMHACLL